MMIRLLLILSIFFLGSVTPASADNGIWYGSSVVREVNSYYDEIFTAMGLEWREPTVHWLEPDNPYDGICGKAGDDATAAGYCREGELVILDESLISAIDKDNDAVMLHVVAHEFAHHAQYIIGLSRELVVSVPTIFGEQEIIDPALELQADCLAGSFLGSLAREGKENSEGVTHVLMAVTKIGDPVPAMRGNPFAIHGSAEQRVESTLRGYEKGIFGCFAVQTFVR